MMKRIKLSLLIVLACMAAGLCFVGKSWAWPTVSLAVGNHLSVGMVAGTLILHQEDAEVSAQVPVLPGEYKVELVSSGDTEGWFILRLTGTERDTEPKVCRTEVMAPGDSVRFQLHLAETAVLTVEGCWDAVDENMDVLLEEDVVFWGQPETEETEDSEDAPTEEPTQNSETEVPETETTEPESGDAAA